MVIVEDGGGPGRRRAGADGEGGELLDVPFLGTADGGLTLVGVGEG